MNEKNYHYYNPKNKDEDLNESLNFMYLLAASYGVYDLEFQVVEHEKLGNVIRADGDTFAKWQEVLSLVKLNNNANQEPVTTIAEHEAPEQKAIEDEDTEVVVDTNDFLAPNLDEVLVSLTNNETSELGSSSSSEVPNAASPSNESKQPRKRSRFNEVQDLQNAALKVISYDSIFAKPQKIHNTRTRFVAVDDEVQVASHLYRQ